MERNVEMAEIQWIRHMVQSTEHRAQGIEPKSDFFATFGFYPL